MRRRRPAILAAAALLALARAAVAQDQPPATQPTPAAAAATTQHVETLAEAKLRESLATAAEAATLPRLTVNSIADVFTLRMRERFIECTTKLPSGEASVAIPELPGLTTVRVERTDDAPDAPLRRFSLLNLDYTAPNLVCIRTEVNQVGPNEFSINQDRVPLEDQVHSVQLLQHLLKDEETEPSVGFFVQVEGSQAARLSYTAKDMIELRRRFPAEVAKYVDPMFRSLRQDELLAKVDTKLAWQVFADAYTPPPTSSRA